MCVCVYIYIHTHIYTCDLYVLGIVLEVLGINPPNTHCNPMRKRYYHPHFADEESEEQTG